MSNTNVRPLTLLETARVMRDLSDLFDGEPPRIDDPAFLRAAIQDALGTLAMLEEGLISQQLAIATIRRDLRPAVARTGVPLRVIRAELKP